MTRNLAPPALGMAGAFTLLACASLTIMVGCAIVPALPSIAPALGVANAASWLVTLPSLGVVLFAPFAGRAIEQFGARPALCLGLALYGLLGLGALLTHGPFVVFADRLLLGGATAFVMAAGTALISEFYQGPARLRMIARQGMAIELGGVLFLFVGGLLAHLGWAGPFALYAMAFVFLLAVYRYVPSRRRQESEAAQRIMAASPVAETSPRQALGLVYAAALLSMWVFFIAVIVLPFRLMRFPSHPFSESAVGYFLAFVSLVAVGAAFLMPRLAQRIGERLTLSVAFAAYAMAHVCFALTGSPYVLVLAGICLGLGFGFSVPLVNHMAVEYSAAAQRGRALARLAMALFLGQFLSSVMEFLPGGPSVAFATAAIVAVVAAGLLALAATRQVPKRAT